MYINQTQASYVYIRKVLPRHQTCKGRAPYGGRLLSSNVHILCTTLCKYLCISIACTSSCGSKRTRWHKRRYAKASIRKGSRTATAPDIAEHTNLATY